MREVLGGNGVDSHFVNGSDSRRVRPPVKNPDRGPLLDFDVLHRAELVEVEVGDGGRDAERQVRLPLRVLAIFQSLHLLPGTR